MTETKALLRLLFRREDVVEHIRAEPLDIRSLTEAVDVSRPTVHRSLKSLQQHDVVVETSEGYALTPYGEFVFDQYEDVIEQFHELHSHRELLLSLASPMPLAESLLDDATFTPALPFAPEKPLSRVETVLCESTVVRGFSPVVVGRYVSMFHQQVTTATLDAEVLTTPDVYEYLGSAWTDQLEEAIDAGMSFLVVDDPLPFGLLVADEPTEKVCVMVYDDGTLRGVIENKSPAAVAWGREVYDSHRDAAERPAYRA